MLVLTRKLGEVVNIGRDVEVFVVGVSAGRVKLGFRAPRDVVIQRAEVASRLEDADSQTVAQSARSAAERPATENEVSTSPPLRVFRQQPVAVVCE